ncbi:MAG: RNA 2',3'-cyclic phosphodiesterase [Acidobacteria bacterium]|nr:RNA 2',3'-cyclic phosphodiesterase [Acidobacteriota bacterium]
MRLFIGLDVPYEMRRNLELLLQLLKPKADIQWSSLANLHLTTKFIGEWPEERLDELKEALAAVPRPGQMQIAIRGLGWFPDARHPRVFWAGIQAPDTLAELARATEARCEGLGIAAEGRDYNPHLTLARVRRPTDLTMLQKAISELPSTDFGVFTSTAFHLYQSKLSPGGSVYTKLANYSLTS